MQEKAYKVMMVRRDIENLKTFFEKIEPDLDIAKIEYSNELIDEVGQPPELLYINDESMCVAFTEENKVVGFITVNPQQETRSLITEHVFVRKPFRKQGVYSLMMKRVEKFANDAGFTRIISFVWNANKTSLKAHKRTGFTRKMYGFVKDVIQVLETTKDYNAEDYKGQKEVE